MQEQADTSSGGGSRARSASRTYAGLAALAGGVAWVVWVVLGERRPPCCPGGVENDFFTYEWWKLPAYGLIAVGAAALTAGVAGHLSRHPRAGAALVALGGALGAVTLALEAAGLVMDRPFPEIAALVLFMPVGTVVLGAGALARRELPRPIAVAFLLGGAVFFAGNGETRAMLLWSGLGVAWALWGSLLLLRAAR